MKPPGRLELGNAEGETPSSSARPTAGPCTTRTGAVGYGCRRVRAGLDGFQFKMPRTANATAMVAMAIDVKTVQIRVGHRRATTTLDIYTQPTAAADRGAAEALGVHFLGSPRADEPSESSPAPPSRASRAMNARSMPSGDPNVHPAAGQDSAPHQGEDDGGASWNRTSDLSIISAAL